MDIRKFKWRTILNRQREEFSALLRVKSLSSDFFNDDFVKSVSQRYTSLYKIHFKVFFIYIISLLVLFFSETLSNSEVRIFGFKVANLNNYKEVILTTSSLFALSSSFIGSYCSRLKMVLEECLKAKCPDKKIRSYYMDAFPLEFIPSFNKPRIEKDFFDVKIVDYIQIALVAIIFALIAIIFIAQIYIQIYVLADIITNPNFDTKLSYSLLTVVLLALTAHYLIVILQLPLPEKNIAYYYQLEDLRKKDIKNYEEKIHLTIKRKSILKNTFLILVSFIFYNVMTYIYTDYTDILDKNGIASFVFYETVRSVFYVFILLEVDRVLSIVRSRALLFILRNEKLSPVRKIRYMNIGLYIKFSCLALIGGLLFLGITNY